MQGLTGLSSLRQISWEQQWASVGNATVPSSLNNSARPNAMLLLDVMSPRSHAHCTPHKETGTTSTSLPQTTLLQNSYIYCLCVSMTWWNEVFKLSHKILQRALLYITNCILNVNFNWLHCSLRCPGYSVIIFVLRNINYYMYLQYG